ncbi:hypothetical protein MMC14_006904, partial [Varicellaria rhodocarpa]|nr:hypothetical protein [Varicellaria rhodocarpa]
MGNIFSTPHIRSHHPPSNVQQTPDRVTIADGLAHFLNQHGEYIRHKRESSEWRHGRRMEKDQQNQQQEESLN